MMPGMSGIEVLRELRGKYSTRDLPVIMCRTAPLRPSPPHPARSRRSRRHNLADQTLGQHVPVAFVVIDNEQLRLHVIRLSELQSKKRRNRPSEQTFT